MNIPRFTGWLLRRMVSKHESHFASGDLEEIYFEKVQIEGAKSARRWLWSEILHSAPRFLMRKMIWRVTMVSNSIKIATRNIRKQRIYSFINIAGLSVGLASCILIFLYIRHELSYDRFHENADRIYRVTSEDHGRIYLNSPLWAQAHNGVSIAMGNEFPEVESVVRLNHWNESRLSYGNQRFLEDDLIVADPELFDVFSFRLIQGDAKTALENPQSIILSKTIAAKYFGNESPLGKEMTFGDSTLLSVTGIFEDLPSNSHIPMQFIVPFTINSVLYDRDLNSYGGVICYTYCLLKPESDLTSLLEKINALPDRYYYQDEETKAHRKIKYSLQSLTSIHLHSDLNFEITETGDLRTITIAGSVAFLLLLIACINYMNLATARAAQRSLEVGIRKVVGAQRSQLIQQFFGETMVFSMLALVLAGIMAYLFLPHFNQFVQKPLQLDLFNDPVLFVGLFCLALFVGLLAGSYPALMLSSFRPITVLQKTIEKQGRRTTLRNVLVVIQFTISVILITGTLVIREQLHFVLNTDIGFNKEQILSLRLRDPSVIDRAETVKSECLRHPGIIQGAFSSHLPDNVDWSLRVHHPEMSDDVSQMMNFTTVDYDFIDLYGIQMADGRKFDRAFPADANGAFILNESAVKALNWEDPIGREFDDWFVVGGGFYTAPVVGIMKDFHMLPLHKPIEPTYFFLPPRFGNRRMGFNQYLSLKIQTDNVQEILRYLEDTVAKFSPGYPFEYQFFDDRFAESYSAEVRASRMISVFALIAIFIACLGLYGLASFMAVQRTKEIGIRKVLGASTGNIALLLGRSFLRWVILANVIAWPVAYFVMQQWLQKFSYRVDLTFLVFIISGGIALVIAMLTILAQSSKAARANPVEALKYE